MGKLHRTLLIVRLNFLDWKRNPKIIAGFVLAFTFCVMLSGRALIFARTYGTTMQIFEPFIWAFGKADSILLSSLLLLFFFGDMPFINQATPYYLIRMARREWIGAQIIYVGIVTIIYLLFLLGIFCLLCVPLSFPGEYVMRMSNVGIPAWPCGSDNKVSPDLSMAYHQRKRVIKVMTAESNPLFRMPI